MYDIDFSIPHWLVTYYHVIGAINLIFDAFSIYLIVFKSEKIDNFRYFLLNFQMACCFTDIHLTFIFQPVPLYPLVSGYVMGLGAYFGATTHVCMCGIIFLLIYQIGSMIACFVKKHQAISGILRKSVIPNILLLFMFLYFVVYTISTVSQRENF